MPEPVGPPTSTRPRGRRVSASTDGGRLSDAKRGTVGRQPPDRRRGAAALVVQVDAEAAEVGRAERAVGDAALAIQLAARAAPAPAATASSISSPPSGASGSGTTWPSMRSDGGAPGTSSRSLADRSTTSLEPARRRAVCSPARRACGAPAFSSVTSASRSSGFAIAPLITLSCRAAAVGLPSRRATAGEQRDSRSRMAAIALAGDTYDDDKRAAGNLGGLHQHDPFEPAPVGVVVGRPIEQACAPRHQPLDGEQRRQHELIADVERQADLVARRQNAVSIDVEKRQERHEHQKRDRQQHQGAVRARIC